MTKNQQLYQYTKLTIQNLKLYVLASSPFSTNKSIQDEFDKIDSKYPRNTLYFKRKKKKEYLGNILVMLDAESAKYESQIDRGARKKPPEYVSLPRGKERLRNDIN